MTDKRTEYIWRCPRKGCGAIVIKTDKPFLKEGLTYRCKRCYDVWTSEDLILYNKKNFQNYIKRIKKRVDDVDSDFSK